MPIALACGVLIKIQPTVIMPAIRTYQFIGALP